MDGTSFKETLRGIASIENDTRRRAMFLALLNRELERRGERPVLLVGGFAVEIYTAGAYASEDIDIKGPKKAVEALLSEAGFTSFSNSTYGDESLSIYVQWLGEGLEAPFENRDRIFDVSLGSPDLRVRIISFEDLIIDRLIQAEHWKNVDGFLWARAIARAAKEAGQLLDWTYLEARATEEQAEALFQKLREENA